MKTICKNEKMSMQLAACKCIISDVTRQSIDMSFRKMLFDCPVGNKDLEYRINLSSCYPGKMSAHIQIHDDKCYDWLMNQKETYLDNSDINCRKTHKMVFVSHQMVEIELVVFVYCRIPKDDYNTLDLLGKVHREIIPARVQESIYCEI